jgi:ABC-type multidrug transport system ATPase subunit
MMLLGMVIILAVHGRVHPARVAHLQQPRRVMTDAAIDIKHITAVSRTKACDDISLQIPKGGIYACSANGAGKTTLFSIIAGFCARPRARSRSSVSTRTRSRTCAAADDPAAGRAVRRERAAIEQIIFYGQLNGRTRAEAEKDAADALALVGLSDAAKSSANTPSHGMYKRSASPRRSSATPR